MLGRIFDRNEPVAKYSRNRPHWSQDDVVTFITFRTADSIPEHVLKRWESEQKNWITQHGYEVHASIPETVEKMSRDHQLRFQNRFRRLREICLDQCLGACELRNPEIAAIVAETLLHFDRQRYYMGDLIVMPNHVHLIAAIYRSTDLKEIVDSWLHYSASKINKALNLSGSFWQREAFDHLIRSEKQYEYFRDYIENNPRKARIKPGEFLYRRLQD